jgi:anti-anti-sigma factor
MELAPESYSDVLVLSPRGRIDHKTADSFEATFLPHVDDCGSRGVDIVLDLSTVDYMSSVGLRVLMAAAKAAKKLDSTIVVAGLQPTLQEIFEISRFTTIFRVFDTVRDGIAALSPTALEAYDRAI